MSEPPVLVTGIRVLDLICLIPRGGILAISGDAGSGVNVVAMETMQNLCRRYEAKATCRLDASSPFNETDVMGWLDKLGVRNCVEDVVPSGRAEILIANPGGKVATLLPFAVSGEDADAWVVLRRSVLEAGRLPAVELSESWSRLAEGDPDGLAQRVKGEVAHGNAELTNYLSQPFFVSEPWTSTPGEVTERNETLERAERLMARD